MLQLSLLNKILKQPINLLDIVAYELQVAKDAKTMNHISYTTAIKPLMPIFVNLRVKLLNYTYAIHR